jgi:opacity protein-like surface antigen
MRLLSITAVTFASLLSFQAIAAENQPYVEGRIGMLVPQNEDVSFSNGATGETKWKIGVGYAGEIGVAGVSGTGLRLGLSVQTASLELDKFCVNGGGCVEGAGEDVSAQVYQVQAYYDFDAHSEFRPYVGFGFGLVDTDSDTTEIAASASVGLNYKVTENAYVGLRADYLYTDTEDTVDLGGGLTATGEETTMWSVGAVIGFRF